MKKNLTFTLFDPLMGDSVLWNRNKHGNYNSLLPVSMFIE